MTCAQAADTTGLDTTPIPSTSTSTTSPFVIESFGSRAQPTPGGVNPSLLHQIADRIRAVNAAGKTLLIVEHDMEFVMNLCGRITVLDQGRVLTTGTPDEVQRDPAVLDAYLGGAEDEDDELDLTAVHV